MSAAQNQVAMAVSDTDAVQFVINLCSSTTPMALTYPATPELKRFSFFVSRRREDGRERFRLHMGYFASAAEAEEWVAVVRDVYPGAWASEAPGRKLRASQAAARSAPAETSAVRAKPSIPAPPQPAIAPPASAVVRPQAPVAPASPRQPPSATSVVQASLAAQASSVVQAPTGTQAPPIALAAQAPPAPLAAQGPSAAEPARPEPFVPTLHAAPTLSEPPVVHPPEPPKTAFEESNLREVLAELGSTPEPALTDTQVLALLEKRGNNKQTPVDPSIRMLKPDDTVTRQALTDAVQNHAPVSFAVQLQWSVLPVDLTRVPPLAIFNAYTLYTIDGSREGRKWYGLRLGFFSDANSARQVAQYVRSEFKSVAVVPVTSKELEHASSPKAEANAPAVGAKATNPRANVSGEFKLVDDSPRKPPAAFDGAPAGGKTAATAVHKALSGRAGSRPASGSARHKSSRNEPAKPYRAPQTLEETLEILGASQMEIDNGRGEFLNDTRVRHLEVTHVTPQKNSAFGRLLDRLTERVRKG